eukprot:TRINITY_DN11251_c0_g1_i1.p1 TRINITY_DN11251_c0_g1~~TRINITY_DN11251_c0_g1_i1.p1  ORF type:complete len:188 (-),score=37.71 TRINITY_DN11251_c0_g1_i1:249-779(-)
MADEESLRTESAGGAAGDLPWESGLFDCLNDWKSCLLGLFCPCVLFGQNVERLHGRSCLGPCVIHCVLGGAVATLLSPMVGPAALWLTCVSCYTCSYRTELRSKYHLPAKPCGDFPAHFFCHMLAICQEHRHLVAHPTAPSNLGFYGGGNAEGEREGRDGIQLSAPAMDPMVTRES